MVVPLDVHMLIEYRQIATIVGAPIASRGSTAILLLDEHFRVLVASPNGMTDMSPLDAQIASSGLESVPGVTVEDVRAQHDPVHEVTGPAALQAVFGPKEDQGIAGGQFLMLPSHYEAVKMLTR